MLIEYVVDGRNRRIAKRVNGVTVQQSVWLDHLRPLAELDGAGNTVAHFAYSLEADEIEDDGPDPPPDFPAAPSRRLRRRAALPDVMVKAVVTYRILRDYLGSPRLVVDATSGIIAQRLDYDEFGNVVLDTNPGFQPFGFAGGLYDPHTRLLRFGARDYDSEMGRWTTKDPIRFEGDGTNLLAYCANDPVNCADPLGLRSTAEKIAQAIGDFLNGCLDAVTFGLWGAGMDAVGLGEGVDRGSTAFSAGEIAGYVGGALAGGGAIQAIRRAREPKIGGVRIAPFGNATNHPIGRWPHYHRRRCDPKGNVCPGQGIQRHRPWERKSTDRSFWDRF
jgi:RHS repeat-associated protein